MTLQNLLNGISVLDLKGSTSFEVESLGFDSRSVGPNSVYVAVKGHAMDGHSFIDQAIYEGAKAVVCEAIPEKVDESVCYILVKDSAEALALLASNFYGNPSSKLTLVGVTGTNGKTSVATLLHDVFSQMQYQCILLSTVENRIGNQVIKATHTTPDVITVNRMLAQAVEEGCEFGFMEVSSHGIDQKRTFGLDYKIAAFTNITHDHLDYHKTFANYIRAKQKLFDRLSSNSVALYNADDKNGTIMVQNTKAKRASFGLKNIADYQAKILEADFNGMLLSVEGKEVWTTLTGKFNASNLLLVYSIAAELGLDKDTILQAISSLKRVNGRFEILRSPHGIYFVVDYAHTPDALENVLVSINEIRTKNERLITVFGCGGDRDKTKRPEMGKIATQNSTLAILTSDNPRTEDPELILKDIEAGIEPQNYSKYTVIQDRKQAIKMAIKFAEPGDIVLVAGKGHETYQDVLGVKHHFDDKEVISELIKIMDK